VMMTTKPRSLILNEAKLVADESNNVHSLIYVMDTTHCAVMTARCACVVFVAPRRVTPADCLPQRCPPPHAPKALEQNIDGFRGIYNWLRWCGGLWCRSHTTAGECRPFFCNEGAVRACAMGERDVEAGEGNIVGGQKHTQNRWRSLATHRVMPANKKSLLSPSVPQKEGGGAHTQSVALKTTRVAAIAPQLTPQRGALGCLETTGASSFGGVGRAKGRGGVQRRGVLRVFV
jgi:hypothetical protein